jgi:hypothetical protein
MKRVVAGVGLPAAGASVVRRLAARVRGVTGGRPVRTRWMIVTVNCPPRRLASRADLPEPITRLGDAVDVRICPAPGDRGTELGVRLRVPPSTRTAVSRRRARTQRRTAQRALRQAKSLIETGEVVRADRTCT